MTIDVKIPQIGESVSEALLGSWLKKDGDFVEMDEPICEIESEKATMEVVAEESGILHILIPEGQTIAVGSVIATIEIQKEAAEAKGQEALPKTPAETEGQKSEKRPKPLVSPVAGEILEKAKIPLEGIQGTGIDGRITKKDALKAVESRQEPAAEKPKTAAKPDTLNIDEHLPQKGKRSQRREKMSALRKTIAKRLVAAKNETALLTTFNEIDMSALVEIRNRYKHAFQEKYGVKLGYMSFFVRASVVALNEFPRLNARIEGDEIVYHDYCDISVAVSTDKGLVVPVIFNAEALSLAEIEVEVARLAKKAREGKLTIDEMTGGTFSITNGGVFGSLLSTPILNSPQSAILGMHKIEDRPVAVNGEIAIHPMMYVALSYDHRIVDGRESVQFLVRIKELLEDPARLLLVV